MQDLENTTFSSELFSTESSCDGFANFTFSNCTNFTRYGVEVERGARPTINIPYAVMESLVAFVAVIGNALVIIAFYRERRLRRRTNYYIISLALADFLVGLLGIPFAILASVGLPKNLYGCLFTTSSLVVLCTISIFCLVAVSIDRYWAILHPLAYSRNVRTKTAIGIISLCWLFGSIIGFLPVFGWHNDADSGECFFTEIMDYNYLVFLYFTTIITPSVILAVFYGLIYRVILKQVNKTTTSIRVTPSSRHSTISSITPQANTETQMLRLLNSAAQKREVKATQNLSIIVAFFMICWIPLYTINCINAFCRECFINEYVIYFGIIMSHMNSAINPLLYAYHLKDFRGALLRLFMCTSDQDTFYRPSVLSQQQNRVTSQLNQRRSFQPRVYIDSPIWKRQQRQPPLQTINESKKIIDGDSGIGKWEPEISESAPSDTNHSPPLQSQLSRNPSSQSKIYIISDSHPTEPEIICEPQSSSLYSIVYKKQELD